MKLKFICLLFLAMTAGLGAQTKKSAAPKKAATTKAAATAQDPGIYAQIETNKGRIVVKLEYQKTPITVANFISLTEGTNSAVSAKYKGKPFYTGLKFHRVIKDFMVQAGDPDGNGSGGPGYRFADEIVPELKHDSAGILSMANAGPGTNGSQFFITHKDTQWLDGKHTVFGKVISGMNVVNAIEQNDVIMEIKIIRNGAEAKKFDAAKIFNDYFANKDEVEKKQLAAEADKKRVLEAEYAPLKAKKVAELAAIKATSKKTESGLQYSITHKGTGAKPTAGTVYVGYAGYLEDGSLFDSSDAEISRAYGKFDSNRAAQGGYEPFPFDISNKGGLIAGFLEGINLMSFGDKATFFIPANLGYGDRGAGNVIPPNSNIIFEVELFEAPKK